MSRPTVGYLELIRTNHNFRNLWYGQIISLLGDRFDLIALGGAGWLIDQTPAWWLARSLLCACWRPF